MARLSDTLDPRRLHIGTTASILTANPTIWQTPIALPPQGFATPPGLQSTPPGFPGCTLTADTFLLAETQTPVEPYLYHGFTYYNPAISASDTNSFEDISQHPEFIRIAVNYDTIPSNVGGVWSTFPSKGTWDAMAPHGHVRNGRGHEVAVAWREHGGEPYSYSVESFDERGRVEALLRYTENLGFDAVYYSYNSLNQVTAVRTADPLRQYTTWYGYDYNERVDTVWTLLQPVNSGLGVMTASYPAAPTRPTSPDIVYDYTKRGQVSTMKYPAPGLTTTYGYNHRGWLQTIVAGGISPMFTETLGYDS